MVKLNTKTKATAGGIRENLPREDIVVINQIQEGASMHPLFLLHHPHKIKTSIHYLQIPFLFLNFLKNNVHGFRLQ